MNGEGINPELGVVEQISGKQAASPRASNNSDADSAQVADAKISRARAPSQTSNLVGGQSRLKEAVCTDAMCDSLGLTHRKSQRRTPKAKIQ